MDVPEGATLVVHSGGLPWVRVPVAEDKRYALCREELLAKLNEDRYQELIAPGGPWFRHVQQHCAKREGDTELLAALNGQQEAALAEATQNLRKRFPTKNVTGNETHTEVIPAPVDPIADLADKARALITQNDPDVVRAGLAEIADALDAMRLPKAA